MKKILILLFLISTISVWPFFKKGFYKSHDGEWMIIRFTAFHQTLTAGRQFPVRFTDRLNNNYGYPVLNFLYPLPFYLSEIPKVIGFGYVDSVKIVFATSTIFSAVAMFWALSQLFGWQASFAGAVLYLFTPYRFVDLYVRGSIGESVAFAIIPLILGSIFKIKAGKKYYFMILSVAIALLILSHNVIAALFLPLFLIISLILIKVEFKKVLISFLLGILMSTFFWLPAIYDLQFVRLSQIKVSNIADHLVTLNRLIVPSWGYGPNPTGTGAFSPQIGLVSLAIVLAAFTIRFKAKKDLLVDIMLAIFIISILLMLNIADLFWRNVPLVDVIQFPWRLLSVTVFISAILTSYVLESSISKTLLSVLIIVASIISTVVYTKPQAFINLPDAYYATNEDTTTVKDEYLPLWVRQKPENRANEKIILPPGERKIISQSIRPASYKAVIESSKDDTVLISSIYFPGWNTKIDGQPVPINYFNPQGLITFKLPKGRHEVIIKYTETPIHLASEIISVLATLVIIFQIFKWQKRSS